MLVELALLGTRRGGPDGVGGALGLVALAVNSVTSEVRLGIVDLLLVAVPDGLSR